MKVKGVSDITHEVYHYDRDKRTIIEVYKNPIQFNDILRLVLVLWDIGIDWRKRNNGYKILLIAPSAEEEAADLITQYGYTFMRSETPEKTGEEIKTLIG